MFDSLPVLRSVSQLRSRVRSWRAFGESVAIAPMSGGLHEGHLSVIREARRRADRVLAAVFIDPMGVEASGTAGDYTADESRDFELLEAEGSDAIYAPALSALLPPESLTEIHLDDLTGVLAGRDDAAVFDSFLRAMARLLNQAQADIVVFGERDWQKLAILRTMSADLALATEVVGVETERDMDGVPFSTAAAGMTAKDRAVGTALWKELQAAGRELQGGAPAAKTLARIAKKLEGLGAEVAYLDLRDAETLAEPAPGRDARLFAEIRVNGAVLADNWPVRLAG